MVEKAIELIVNAKHITAFTGAGISVESGIPPFRGKNGLWNKYDPTFLEISYFHSHPNESWKLIKEVFYDFFGKAKPNAAHIVLAELEEKGILNTVITQNIDNLHQLAGSKIVWEFHGNSRNLICIGCRTITPARETDLTDIPPKCIHCKALLKPDFIFFGEPIPEPARTNSFLETEIADLFILIGTTGKVMPASFIPYQAKGNGARIIEVNTQPSNYTNSITDIFLQGKAGDVMTRLWKMLENTKLK